MQRKKGAWAACTAEWTSQPAHIALVPSYLIHLSISAVDSINGEWIIGWIDEFYAPERD